MKQYLHRAVTPWILQGKRVLPKSLFGRALLILVLPTLLVQLLAITVFFDRHWSSVQRHMASSLAGEVAVVVERVINTSQPMRDASLTMYAELMRMDITLLPVPEIPAAVIPAPARYEIYSKELTERLAMPFSIFERNRQDIIRTEVLLSDTIIRIDVNRKRLESSTTSIFVLWVLGSSLLFMLIAVIFLRNQIRPIARLAKVAERFGRGQDISDFRPHGALEVRQAGKAFLTMRARLMRQIQTRTAMLSGISHDLRTPLTRLKLELEMMPQTEDTLAMRRDVDDMDYMITEYLDFARGSDDNVPSEMIDIASWLREIIERYSAQAAITYSLPETVSLLVRPAQLKRAVQNILNNALHYGKSCHMRLEINDAWVMIAIEDEGPGIPQESFSDVFRPFVRLDSARNADQSANNHGSGLGLAITRDIIQSHGGKVHLHNRIAEDGSIAGLTVLLTLPLPQHTNDVY